MDSRWYFVFGDLLVSLLAGAVAAWFSALLVGVGWPMLAAMLVAMALGMMVGLFVFFPFSILFGAMEVMLPAMFTGMVSGMIIGMWAAMHPLEGGSALLAGACCGLICLSLIWILNTRLRGVRSYG